MSASPQRRRPLRSAALGVAAFLAACSGDDVPPPPCPPVNAVTDAGRMVAFRGEGRDLTDVRFEARIADLAMTCDYEPDDEEIEAELRVVFAAERGPANTTQRARFRYFVAVATRDQQILAREEFDVTIPLEGNRTRAGVAEVLTPRIPLTEGRTGADYVVFVGLALTRDQLEYNRRNRSGE